MERHAGVAAQPRRLPGHRLGGGAFSIDRTARPRGHGRVVWARDFDVFVRACAQKLRVPRLCIAWSNRDVFTLRARPRRRPAP
jgi:hypothetical protein